MLVHVIADHQGSTVTFEKSSKWFIDVIQFIEGKETILCPSCSEELRSTETEVDESTIEELLAAPSTSQPMEDVALSTEGSDIHKYIHQSTPKKRDLWNLVAYLKNLENQCFTHNT